MKRNILLKRNRKQNFFSVEEYEGETIENKCSRITENKEPISDGAPLVYTKRKDGVLPQYDIRTDKWDIALDTMDKVAKAKKSKIKESMKSGMTQMNKENTEEDAEKEN